MPAVALTFTASVSQDSTTLTITDTTPNGTGTTGYGQTGGLAVADVTEATLGVVFTFSDTTSESYTIPLFPTAFNPDPFVVGEVYMLQMDSFGGTAGDKFRDCVMQLTYTVTGEVDSEEVSYSADCTQANFQQACCCINTKLSQRTTDDAELTEHYMDLKGAISAAGCGKSKQALEILSAIEKYCNNECPDC